MIYDVDIVHVRSDPVRHEVRHRSQLWFVGLDDLPHTRFNPRDHVGDPSRSLRANVDAYLAEHGIDLRGGRITMLANPRGLGYVFNPLTLYWCHDRDGTVVAVVAEVHNTYRQRHRYLLRPDDAGRADVAKEFYVSPFHPVDGTYRMSLPEPADRLALTITLHRPGGRPFVATVRGVPATRSQLFTTWRVRAAITKHGIALWRKGLPIQPRPEAPMPTTADRLAALVRDVAGVELPVRLRAWDGSESGPAGAPTVVLRSRRAVQRLLWAPGELGLARAYVSGDLEVDGDLAEGFRSVWTAAGSGPAPRVRLRPRPLLAAVRLGALGPPPQAPRSEARLHGATHTRRRDRAAIAHHYDLSNEFYELLLDDTMAYSCAYFTESSQSMSDAQRAKLDLICRRLDLGPGQRLLDVGCGWGSLVLHAAEHYGVRATGVTLSAQQRDFVAKRIADRGLTDRVDVRLQDYRDLRESGFDAVASIEMGEHVGQEQYSAYAGILRRALKSGGRLLLQQMSRHLGTPPGGGAFIEAYIAPDMHMRPLPRTVGLLEDAGFEIRHVEALREHYVATVRHWHATLEARWPDVVALVGEELARVWRLYLVGGALAFEQGRMGVDQILAVPAG